MDDLPWNLVQTFPGAMKLTDFPLVMFVIHNERSQQLIDGRIPKISGAGIHGALVKNVSQVYFCKITDKSKLNVSSNNRIHQLTLQLSKNRNSQQNVVQTVMRGPRLVTLRAGDELNRHFTEMVNDCFFCHVMPLFRKHVQTLMKNVTLDAEAVVFHMAWHAIWNHTLRRHYAAVILTSVQKQKWQNEGSS